MQDPSLTFFSNFANVSSHFFSNIFSAENEAELVELMLGLTSFVFTLVAAFIGKYIPCWAAQSHNFYICSEKFGPDLVNARLFMFAKLFPLRGLYPSGGRWRSPRKDSPRNFQH
jgi:hypothetical protein